MINFQQTSEFSKDLKNLQTQLLRSATKNLPDQLLVRHHKFDSEIPLSILDLQLYSRLQQFAPFGPENMSPIFITKELMDKGYVRIVGNNHLKMDVLSNSKESESFPAIAFSQAQHFDAVLRKNSFSAIYAIEENVFNGTVSLQLNVKDMKME